MKNRSLKLSLIAAVSAMLLTACGSAAQPVMSSDVVTEDTENAPSEAPEEEEEETEPVHEHEWIEATFASPKTCITCRETEGEPRQTYFEEHGAQVKDAPVDCTVDAVIYNPDNTELQMTTDFTWQQLDCYSEPAQEEGYQLVHLELLASGQTYYDGTRDIAYHGMQESQECYDWYTGRVLPGRDFVDNDTMEYTVTIEVDDVSYDVSYTAEYEWKWDGWTADANGDQHNNGSLYATFTFKIPEDYDGLVFAAVPHPEYDGEELDTENIDESEKYAFDDDQYVEGTVFFRINKEGMAPLREAEE